MYKLCKWIYELGYKAGYEQCRQEIQDSKLMDKAFASMQEQANLTGEIGEK